MLLAIAALLILYTPPAAVRICNSPSVEVSASWPMFHHDLQRTGYQSVGTGRINEPRVLWRFSTQNPVYSSPAIVDLNGDNYPEVVFGSTDGYVYCLNATGNLVWRFSTGGRIYVSPAVEDLDNDGDVEVVIASEDCSIYCLNSTGCLEWSYASGAAIYSCPAIADLDKDGYREVLIGSDDGFIYCLNASGHLLWRFQTGAEVKSSPAVVDLNNDGFPEIVFGSHDNNLYCLNVSGHLVWNYSTNGYIRSTPAIADLDADGCLEIVFGSFDGRLYCLNATGDLLWSFSTSNWVRSSPAVADLDGDGFLEIVVGSRDYCVYCLNATGHLLWNYTTGYYVESSPAVADLNGDGFIEVVVGSWDGYLYCFDSYGSLLWRYGTGFSVKGSPSIADVDLDGFLEVFFGSYDNDLYCIDWSDYMPPSISVSSPQNGTYYNSPGGVLLNFTATDDEWIRGFRVYLNGSTVLERMLLPAQTSVSVEFTLPDLTDGCYEILIQVWDPFFNTEEVLVHFYYDTTSPSLKILSPENASFTNSTKVLVEWEGQDNMGIDHYEVLVDKELVLVTNDTLALLNFSEGERTFYITVVAFDRACNAYNESIYLNIDTVPPYIEILLDSKFTNRRSLNISWVVYDRFFNSAFALLDDVQLIPIEANTSFTLSDLSEGNHTLHIKASDLAGNLGCGSLSFLADYTRPTIRIETSSGIYTTPTLQIRWTASDKLSGIRYFVVYLDGERVETLPANRTSYDLKDLEDGSHNVRVKAIDKAGNTAEDTLYFVIDTAPPKVLILSPANGTVANETTITVEWKGEDAGSGIAFFLVYLNESLVDNTTLSYCTLENLTSGTYLLEVMAIDYAYHNSSSCVVFSVTVTAPTQPVQPSETEGPTPFSILALASILIAAVVASLIMVLIFRKRRTS